MRLVIFTDLDGTLLDHDTYEWRPALRTLERIQDEGWPLVFVTSKTRAEVEQVRAELGVDEPFIVENGAAVFFPARYDDLAIPGAEPKGSFRALVFGRPYAEVRAFAESARDRYGLEGFGDMDVERISALTGLPPAAAERARQREFTEPFRLRDDGRLEGLRGEAARAGFGVTTGGRLHHLIGAEQDKGTAVRAVQAVFEQAYGTPTSTIGLGDGPNDVPMLEAVDHAILIPAPDRPLPPLAHPPAVVAPAAGPSGWSAALEKVLDALQGEGSAR